MNRFYKYFTLNQNIYVRIDIRTHNYQFLNKEKMWEDKDDLKEILEKTSDLVEITNENILNVLNSFPNKVTEIPKISQKEFDQMNDIEKLKYMSQISRRTNHIFDNANKK